MRAGTISPVVSPPSRPAPTESPAPSLTASGSKIASIPRRRNSGSRTRRGLVEGVADPGQRVGDPHARAGERAPVRAGVDVEAGEIAAAGHLTFPPNHPRTLRLLRLGDQERLACELPAGAASR